MLLQLNDKGRAGEVPIPMTVMATTHTFIHVLTPPLHGGLNQRRFTSLASGAFDITYTG